MAKLTQQELERMLPEKRRAYEKRRKKVRRNQMIFASSVALLITVITVLILSVTVLFPIDTISVVGTSRYDTQQIINISGVIKGKNLFLTSTQRASENITVGLPYISKAVVTRKLPSTIVIEITGTTAAYCYKTTGGYALTDSNSKVLEIVKSSAVPQGCAEILTKGSFVGEVGKKIAVNDEFKKQDLTEKEMEAKELQYEQDKKELEVLNSVFNSIKESSIKDITEIDVTTPASIYLTYQNRFKLSLGTTNELTYKLKSAVEIIKKEDEISTTTSGEINLTNPGSAYVSPNAD